MGRILLPVLALAVGLAFLRVGSDYWCDDAFISFRYARQLVRGHGLVYNAGAPVEGYTNFLWTLTAAAALGIGVPPIRAAQALSLALVAVTLWALYRLARPLGRGAFLPPLLLALDAGFVSYPMTGMETTAFTAAATLALLWLREERPAAAGLALLALGLLRFDGFVLAGVLLAAHRLSGGSWRGVLRPALLCGAGLAAYNLWRLSTYPTWLPNSFYAKIGFTPERFLAGLRYVGTFVVRQGSLLVPAALAGLLLGPVTPLLRSCLWVGAAQGAYAALVGGDWMPHGRFLLPALPALCLLAGQGALRVAVRLAPAVAPGRRPGGYLLGMLLLFLHSVPLWQWRAFDGLRSAWFDPREGVVLGRGLGRRLPRDALVAVEWGGIVPYYLPQPVLDTWGITDPAIARGDFPRRVTGREISLAYLAARRPAAVIPCVRVFPTAAAARAAVAPGGCCRYRDYLGLTEHGYELRIVRVAPGAYAPLLCRPDLRLSACGGGH